MKLTRKRRCAAARKSKRQLPAFLAKLDDAAIDLTIDGMELPQVKFSALARKSSANYHPRRGVDRSAISEILRPTDQFNIKSIHTKLFKLPCFKKFRVCKEKSNSQSEWFDRQLQSYLQIYTSECPFRIGESECLSGIDREAAVFAKMGFKKGEIIRFLSGVCVPLTKEEETQLQSSGQDFSILQSTRYEPAAMFLGPARFVNHDCRANSEIIRPNSSTAYVVAVHEILEGDEITVFYGKDYFGNNNEACRCLSCSTEKADPLNLSNINIHN